MKIAISQLNYHIGNFESNVNKMIQSVRAAKQQKADLIVFAELAISGYPPRDFLEFNDFIRQCDDAVDRLAKECVDIAAIVGSPAINYHFKGKRLYNTAFFLEDGELRSKHFKTLLPNYDIFDEYRYFEPNTNFEVIHYKDTKIALTICEDLWNIGDEKLYTINPMEELARQEPDIMINIAASPFHYRQAEIRKEILRKNVEEYQIPLVYVNHVGAQTELVFDGGSLVMDKNARIVEELAYFEEDFRVVDTHKLGQKQEVIHRKPEKIALIHDALVVGIRNYFEKLGFKKAILGLSGGIDSAVVAVLGARALGSENVRAVLMPSQYSSDHSVKDAEALAINLGMPYDIVSIQDNYESFLKNLTPLFEGKKFDVTEENIQSRTRGLILMALANKFGYILLNTSNKSELAVGYGTLYGDMNGGISVIGDVYKTDVFALAKYINRKEEIIPWNTITKPPSAELRPDQKDSDSLPQYDVLDAVLYHYIEEEKGPDEIIRLGFDETLVHRTLRLVNLNEYKRYQTPPIIRISSKAFGIGRRMPIVAKYLTTKKG
jgi:NAD+ synthase (glutamine-hydrolysing)